MKKKIFKNWKKNSYEKTFWSTRCKYTLFEKSSYSIKDDNQKFFDKKKEIMQ